MLVVKIFHSRGLVAEIFRNKGLIAVFLQQRSCCKIIVRFLFYEAAIEPFCNTTHVAETPALCQQHYPCAEAPSRHCQLCSREVSAVRTDSLWHGGYRQLEQLGSADEVS